MKSHRCISATLAVSLLVAGHSTQSQDALPPAPVEASKRETPFSEIGKLTYLKTGDPLVDWNSHRTLTSTDGRSLAGKVITVSDGQVQLQLANGKTVPVPLDRLIEDDRRFLAEWAAVSKYFNLGYEKPRTLTDIIEPELFDGAFANAGKIHETRNFRFECDVDLSQEVVKDFSKLFEVTYLAVQGNPVAFALAEPKEGKFLVKLFSSEEEYIEAGGTTTSAGIYIKKDRMMLVPLKSLGLEPGARGYRKARNFDPRTLMHETTHALTHQWLDFKPMWIIEGYADYISAIPFENGRLDPSRHAAGVADLAAKRFGGNALRFPLGRLDEFATISQQAFMDRSSETTPEEPIILTPVEPYLIVVRRAGEVTPMHSMPAKTYTPPMTMPAEVGIKPIIIPPVPAPGGRMVDTLTREDAIVSVRYTSSLALVHYVYSSGQTDALRRYLFDFLRFEWDRSQYLEEFISTKKQHHEAVQAQIADYNTQVEELNRANEAYNEAVVRINGGEKSLALPPKPGGLVAPDAIPVPEILINPRTPEELSRQQYRQDSLTRHLKVPEQPEIVN